MPHQCLNCGETFEDGSTDLLKGCPSCEGTRFFFTEEPLAAEERAELKEETDKNVHEMLREIMDGDGAPDAEKDIWSREAWEDWVRLKTSKDLSPEEAADLLLEGEDDTGDGIDTIGDVSFEPITKEEDSERLREATQVTLDDVEEASPPEPDAADELEAPELDTDEPVPPGPNVRETRPSTLNIVDAGQYEIDVERLMEDSPVIVERDGSYVIHLPSVFERGKRKR